MVWTDESTFKFNGYVNRHNCVYYATENPHIVITQEVNAPGVIAWAEIWSGGLIGPFFVRDTVTGHSYLEKLDEEIVPAIEYWMNLEEIYYIYDGAPAHYDQSVQHFLDKIFLDRWIGRCRSIDWLARSPDLTPTDSFMGCDQRPCVCNKTSNSSSTRRCYYYINADITSRIMSKSFPISTRETRTLDRVRG